VTVREKGAPVTQNHWKNWLKFWATQHGYTSTGKIS
jgi:hypothetical protein